MPAPSRSTVTRESSHKPAARRPQPTRVGAALLLAALALPAAALDYTSAVVASGLNSPRGLTIGPDGALWVAEAGIASGSGPSTTFRNMLLVGNYSGSVTRVDLLAGTQARVVGGLPALYVSGTPQMEAGPSDIGFDAGGMPSILIGGGTNPGVRAALAPIGAQLGRLVTFGGAVDVAQREFDHNPDGAGIDSNPWRFTHDGSTRLVTDAAANALQVADADGNVTTRATFASRVFSPVRPTEAVPTGVAVGPDGAAYVGELTGFPFPGGQARVHRVAADGTQSVYASGFTMIIDLAFDAGGNLFVLEYDTNGLLAPGSAGRLSRVAAGSGAVDVVWTAGLVNPTGLAIGADGSVYVSNHGNAGAGLGDVLRISPVPEPATQALALLGVAWVIAALRRRRD